MKIHNMLFGSAFVCAGVLMAPLGAHAAMQVAAAPELDPGSAFAAITLLSGALTVARGRRARKASKR